MVAMTIYQQIVSFYRLKTSTAIIFAWDFRWKFSLNYSARVHSITLFQFTWKPVALKICEKRHDTHGTGRLGSPDGTNGVTVAFPFLSSLARLSLCRHIKNPPPFYKEGHARRSSTFFFFLWEGCALVAPRIAANSYQHLRVRNIFLYKYGPMIITSPFSFNRANSDSASSSKWCDFIFNAVNQWKIIVTRITLSPQQKTKTGPGCKAKV